MIDDSVFEKNGIGTILWTMVENYHLTYAIHIACLMLTKTNFGKGK